MSNTAEIYKFPTQEGKQESRMAELENGYLRLANQIQDALCIVELSGREFRVLNAIVRLTYGWSKKSDRIANKGACEVDDEPAYRRNVYTPAVNTPEEKRPPAASSAGEYEDPLDFLKSVMNNVGYEIETRKDAAKAMLPYMHQKKGEGGKKDAKAEAAKKAANKFAIQQPPKLVVNNRGNT
ncbi:replication protein [Salmonella enterica subsp. enterica serovar Anatum]|nr:replication protein [Salmonella enterica subsp. enterica serovar Anatum]EFR3283911.1 replication protein [Salmonella enterica]EGC6185710.1 replication protein [Salmonella enterica]EGN1133394.1 replication protein [Salmonella enterica subsp. enterica serovar Anatum]